MQKQAGDFQIITHKKKKKKRKYYDVSSTSDNWSNDSDCQQVDKRQKTKTKKRGSNEQKQGNRKEKKDSRQLSCNSHCSFDQAMRSSGNTHANSRLPTFIDSHPRLIQLHKFTIQVTAENTSKYVHLCYNLFGASAICNSLIGEHAFSRAMYVQE